MPSACRTRTWHVLVEHPAVSGVTCGKAGAVGDGRPPPRGGARPGDGEKPAPRVAVIGGGITGLAAAWRLAQRGIQFTLFEKGPACGGVIRTEYVGGFLLEAGPDSWLARKPWARELCDRLALGDEVIPTNAANRGSFILFRGRLHELPEGLTSLVPTRLAPLLQTSLLSARGKARLLLEPLLPRRPAAGDESLAGFFRRRLGAEASRRLVEPLVRGIYGGDPATLSLSATFPRLPEIEARHGSLIRGLRREERGTRSTKERPPPPAFLSLRHGLGSLADRLLESLPEGSVRPLCGVRRVRRTRSGSFELGLESATVERDETARFDALVVATPACAAGALLSELDPPLSSLLAGIRAGSSFTVALGFRAGDVRHPLRGHGFVVPEEEPGPLLACSWSSSKFPCRAPPGHVLLRAFVARPDAFDQDGDPDDDLDGNRAEAVLCALSPILGFRAAPVLVRVHRWTRALPRYAVGHVEHVERIQRRAREVPGLFLAGASYRGVGVPDCVRDGEAAAEAAAEHVATTQLGTVETHAAGTQHAGGGTSPAGHAAR
ncbi:MAG: protoporphyrinogen oxidase [Gemmatimonadetes bacterium]|nr:protoporphyrinogen oxidase [Gemmatimonadota bacterium]